MNFTRAKFLALQFCVFSVSLVILMYAVGTLFSGIYAGGWPLFMYFVCLYLYLFCFPLQNKLNRQYLVCLLVTVGFTFSFLIIAKANIGSERTPIFRSGVPTIKGIIVQISVCIFLLSGCIGLSQLFKSAIKKIARKT